MKIALLREAGGLGDVLRCLGTARSIKTVRPDAEIWFYAMSGYSAAANICPDVDHAVNIHKTNRRARDEKPDPEKHPYLQGVDFDHMVDMFCPAWRYERKAAPNIKRDRYDCWNEAAAKTTGLPLEPMVPRIVVPQSYKDTARTWLLEHGWDPEKPLIGVAPYGAHALRRLSFEQLGGILKLIKEHGMQFIILSTWKHRFREIANEYGGMYSYGDFNTEMLFGAIEHCETFITVDTGTLHLASILGKPCTSVFSTTHGKYLCLRYPLARYIDHGPEERHDLKCTAPCYHIKFGNQKSACMEGRGCIAMNRISAERIFEVALEQIAVRR